MAQLSRFRRRPDSSRPFGQHRSQGRVLPLKRGDIHAPTLHQRSVQIKQLFCDKPLAAGRLQQGIGTKVLFNSVFEARGAHGARVVFRVVGDKIEILAKFHKNQQKAALAVIRRLYEE